MTGSSQRSIKIKGSLSLCFVGRVAKEKNLLFALSILQDLELENIQFNIIGEIYDQAYWNKCEDLIDSLSKKMQIKMLGSLSPDDLQNELDRADVLFLPTRGENYGHAIYESLASGLPVLISDQTPWVNLKKAKAGIDLALMNREHFIEAIELFWNMGSSEFIEWSKGAQKYAQKKVDFDKIKSEYIRLFK